MPLPPRSLLHPPTVPGNSLELHGDDRRRQVPRMRLLEEVKEQNVKWLWPDRIPLGKVTLLCGDPGLGKSFLTLDIAARVSTGRGWPDCPQSGEPPGTVLLLSAEDDAADTIRPRLTAAAADSGRVAILDGVYRRANLEPGEEFRPGNVDPLKLPLDMLELEEAIDRLPECRLVVVDPISAYLDGVNAHRNEQVRAVLAELALLAARWDIAIVAVTHLTKSTGQPSIYRAMGSLAFVAAARAAWVVTRDKTDVSSRRRLLLPLKNNLGHDETGLAFHLASREGALVPALEWEAQPVTTLADEALARESPPRLARREAARAWLADRLAAGPVPTGTLLADAAAAGHAEKTVRRGLSDLRCETRKCEDGWKWALQASPA